MRPDAYDIKERQRRQAGRGATSLRTPRTRRRSGVWKRVLVAGVVAILAYFGADHGRQLYQTLSEQRIRFVKLEGALNNVREQEIKLAFAGFMNQSMIAVDLEQVQASLEAHPWIRDVQLRREWPDTMIIDVTEERAIARWGEQALLNQEGRVFTPSDTTGHEHLPRLMGPSGSEREVMEQYQKFNQLLYPLGMRMSRLEMSARGGWEMSLDNGVKVRVGKHNIMDRMRRFVTLVDVLLEQNMDSLEAVDLRYSNGVAVSKRKPEPEELASN